MPWESDIYYLHFDACVETSNLTTCLLLVGVFFEGKKIFFFLMKKFMT